MKGIVSFVVAVLLVMGLAGCATMAKEPMKVKCPACGHEFMSPGAEAHGP